ncbi:hypothetical protein ABLO26_01585 [Neobacillus sp. 179-J 1A1 HS]
MFFAYLFVFAYIIGSVWVTYAIMKGSIEADVDFLKVHNTK